MLVGVINCYNDMPLIKNCIESIYSQVDKIIAIDGSYADFPDGSGYSTDGTIEYLTSLDKVELITTFGLSEVAKRLSDNCIETANNYQWSSVIDRLERLYAGN